MPIRALLHKKAFIMTHVDDCMCVAEPELMPKIVDMIKLQYSIRDLGFPANYLDCNSPALPSIWN
jgi:hypothetical protein